MINLHAESVRLGGTPCKGVVETSVSQHLCSLIGSDRLGVIRITVPQTGRSYLGKPLWRNDAGVRPVKIEMNDTIKTESARDGLLDLVARRTEVGEIKCGARCPVMSAQGTTARTV